MRAHPDISRDRVLSEIGILFVEGFETTGARARWRVAATLAAPKRARAQARKCVCSSLPPFRPWQASCKHTLKKCHTRHGPASAPPPPNTHTHTRTCARDHRRLAGHTTSWTLFNIATAPGVQEQVAAELERAGLLVTPDTPAPRELEWDDLKALPYLTACAKEAMRMLPVVSVMGRCARACVQGEGC
jgi:cytochrome P450